MPIWYGGDYNPEQWPREVWDEDVQLMQRAGVTLATVGVFSWAKLEPVEGEFDFEWLDVILDKLHAGGVRVDLATATASPPPWLSRAYPETLPVTADGVRLHPGSRQHYCPSSPTYRRLAKRLVTQLVERYGDHPAIEMWHINNEYGCHVSRCFCDVSADAFRSWLKEKYRTVAALNQAWGTAFWSQGYADFAEVLPPRAAPTLKNPTQLLDFDRFSSDELLQCFLSEREVIRERTPHIPVTTNFMGFFKPVDYWAWAKELDIISDDSYPDPSDPDSPVRAAMSRDLMRSLGGGKSWLLMEQATSAVNWRAFNAPKAPGQQRAWSYQAVARGADGILFFQWRQSVSGAEKFHSGLVPHAGTNTRVWREVEQLGRELGALDRVAGSRVDARVAIVIDWDSWWALEQPASPAQLSYLDGVFAWYRGFFERDVVVDFVSTDHDLADYTLVVVPSLFAATSATAERLSAQVARGGTVLVTYQSFITDENLRVSDDGYLRGMRDTLGVWIEEFAPLAQTGARLNESVPGSILLDSEELGEGRGHIWAEFVHAEAADVLARFGGGALSGWPAITRRAAEQGSGAAWYVATLPDASVIETLLERVLDDTGVPRSSRSDRRELEVVTRGELTFYINHGAAPVAVALSGADLLGGPSGARVLESQEVAIVER